MVRSAQKGFTLLELIVALAIFAAMYVMAEQFFSNAVTSRDILQGRAAHLEAMQRTLTFLTMDFEQIAARPARDEFGDPQPAIASLDNGGVVFTRAGWANPFALQQRSDLQRVSWFLDGTDLVRRYWPVLDRNVAVQPVDVTMLKDVATFQVRYLEASTSGYQWDETWPVGKNADKPLLYQQLPRSVEITITLNNGEELHRYFRTVINPWLGGG